MHDQDAPEFWRELKPGGVVTLTDEQSLEESMLRDDGLKGRQYIIEEILKVQQQDGLAEWLLFRLDDEERDVYLVAKIVGGSFDLYVYFEPDEFAPGDRKDLVDRGDTWIFAEPDDVDDFKISELQYADELVMAFDDPEAPDGEFDVAYQMKGQGVLYGVCRHEPAYKGPPQTFAAVVEYEADEDAAADNSHILILELGGETGDQGGLISFLLGCPIALSETDVMPNQAETPVERKKPSLWERAIKKLAS